MENWQAKFNEFNSSSKQKIIQQFTEKNLHLIINPTEKCNFRCKYCYEDFKIGKMKPSVVSSIIKFVQREIHTCNSVELSWFGGEPLLAKNIVSEVTSKIRTITDANDVPFVGQITTNGDRLDSETFEKITRFGVRFYQITLDGDREFHDSVRLRADGGGTFDSIWNNLLETRNCSHDFSITIRLHLHKNNIDSLVSLLSRISKDFRGDSRYQVCINPIEYLGGNDDLSDCVMPHEKFVEKSSYLKNLFSNELKIFVAGGEGKSELANEHKKSGEQKKNVSQICYACKPNSYMIRPDGRVGKCTIALTEDYNTIGFIQNDGKLILDKGKHSTWLEGLRTLNARELECPNRKLAEINS